MKNRIGRGSGVLGVQAVIIRPDRAKLETTLRAIILPEGTDKGVAGITRPCRRVKAP